jgi:hypothetical protein
VNSYVKQMRYGIEATNPHVAKMCFKHNVLREFCDLERDIKIEEIISIMRIKKEDELCILTRKVCSNSVK